MSKEKLSVTPAIRVLRESGIEYTDHPYTYEDHGGTEVCARELQVPEHSVIKTLIMEDERKNPLIVLMHGDLKVSTKELARVVGTKSVTPCDPAVAQRHSGYQVGGTSPFGTRKKMPVFMEATIADLPRIYINGGRRGYLVGMDPKDAVGILKPALVRVGIS